MKSFTYAEGLESAGAGLLNSNLGPSVFFSGGDVMSNPLYRPTSFYRMQFHAGFTFADAANAVPYLRSLGVSHLYTSPILAARPGSTHGYDIVDHGKLNPELGGRDGFDALSRALSGAGIGLVVDIVPNHMGIGFADNAWWLDVLEWGRSARYAHYFDIDWFPETRGLRNKVLLPVLGDLYGKVLERGEFRLSFDAESGSFSVFYYEHRFPVCPATFFRIIRRCLEAADSGLIEMEAAREILIEADRLRSSPASATARKAHRSRGEVFKGNLAKTCRDLTALREALEKADLLFSKNSPDRKGLSFLHRLLEVQHYRPAFWRVARHEINYRRFFQINDLAGLRVEDEEVFDASHRLIRSLVEQGLVHGLRIDHVDGLYDPVRYLERLQAMAAPFADRLGFEKGRFPVYVEKILEEHESLRSDWPVHGTTGYDALAEIGSILPDPDGVSALKALYEAREGSGAADVEAQCQASKRAIMERELASELEVLANETARLLKGDPVTRDFTRAEIRQALHEIASRFPVYRTYVGPEGPSAEDGRDLDWALGSARKAMAMSHPYLFDVLEEVLKGRWKQIRGRRPKAGCLRLARKFQQFTGPVMAKGVEDTAFYRIFPLASLNEVGGGPARQVWGPGEFHQHMARRREMLSQAMVNTTTHDTKRSEDVRARISAFSEFAGEWAEHVDRWQIFNRRARRDVNDRVCPSSLDEYLFYQTLLGVWPVGKTGGDSDLPDISAELRERLESYMVKAAREAKNNTSWLDPDQEYEAGLRDFVSQVTGGQAAAPFLKNFDSFARKIAVSGACNSLSQLVLKLTVPGVPDTYQGTEFWDDSLVDPDNRRPVDYGVSLQGVEAIRAALSGEEAAVLVEKLAGSWWDGRIKQYILWRLLNLRRDNSGLFLEGDYRALEVTGGMGRHVIAFSRSRGDSRLIVAVSRLTGLMGGGFPPDSALWKDSAILAVGDEPAKWSDILSGKAFSGAHLFCSDLFSLLPVAVLLRGDL